MNYAVDLHIHTALSPCACDDMTPANIVNMAKLKGLDIIAVTDHNSSRNVEAVVKFGIRQGLTVVPGMEVETREEVHLVCLFPDTGSALSMQDKVYNALPDLKNRENIFGRQLVMDEYDNIIGFEDRLLLTATSLSVEDVFRIVSGMGGVVIPAHVDRGSYSIISNLGMVPDNLGIKYLEYSANCDLDEFTNKNRHLGNFKFIRSSDAHYLGDILEREMFIELVEPSVECLIEKLKT